jgi:hypothetical protein
MSKNEAEKVGKEQPDGVQSVKQPEIIDVADMSKTVGRYIILWRNESKQIAKIETVTADEMTYCMVTGPDKGKRFGCKFFAKTLKVYEDENLILATTE